MTTYTAIGTDDSINTCDCCGKSNLKSTVIMQSSDGEILHYGSVCAQRNTGKTSKVIKQEITKVHNDKVEAARKEMLSSFEYKNCANRMNEAYASKITPGKPFREFCREASDVSDAKRKEIANKYNLNVYEF